MYPYDTRSNWIGDFYFSIGGLRIILCWPFGRQNMVERRQVYYIVYIIGSTINGLSNTYASLLLGRFICGLGAGSALVITSSILTKFLQLRQKGYWDQ